MIYKLLHSLFKWDYINWSNSVDNGIARVHKDGQGVPYYWRYKTTKFMDKITSADQVTWLTCKPDKYLPKRK